MKLALPLIAAVLATASAHSPMGSMDSMGSDPESMESMDSMAESDLADPMPSHNMHHVVPTDLPPSPAPAGAMHGHHGMPILEDPNLEPQQRAYWEAYDTTNFLNENITEGHARKSFLRANLVLTGISWGLMYPLTVVLSSCASAFAVYFALQTLQSIVAVTALFCLAVYAPSAPALYPGNAYIRMSFVLFLLVVAHWFSLAIKTLAARALGPSGPLDGTDYMLTDYHAGPEARLSHDSGHGSQSDDLEAADLDAELGSDVDMDVDDADEASSLRDASSLHSVDLGHRQTRLPLLAHLAQIPRISTLVRTLEHTAAIVYTLVNKPLFIFAFIYLLTGVANFYCLGKANDVYNILAHFIKGGVFFLFGLVTLGRYCGAFANHGMAWNQRPGTSLRNHKKSLPLLRYLQSLPPRPRLNIAYTVFQGIGNRIPTMEFVECFLIFIYGISNIFLEHLGNETGEWSHKDLQHVSIAFLYLGGGICGLLVELGAFRRILRFGSHEDADDNEIDAARRNISFNPIPAFTVFWTGALMSQHQQELPLSTEIHKQWGTLLCAAAVFRLLTYLLIYVAPPTSSRPSKPFTELLVAFCLVCGGMIFIESNSQTVEAMIYYGLDSMFSLNVNVGCAILLMSWEMAVLAIRDYFAHR